MVWHCPCTSLSVTQLIADGMLVVNFFRNGLGENLSAVYHAAIPSTAPAAVEAFMEFCMKFAQIMQRIKEALSLLAALQRRAADSLSDNQRICSLTNMDLYADVPAVLLHGYHF